MGAVTRTVTVKTVCYFVVYFVDFKSHSSLFQAYAETATVVHVTPIATVLKVFPPLKTVYYCKAPNIALFEFITLFGREIYFANF